MNFVDIKRNNGMAKEIDAAKGKVMAVIKTSSEYGTQRKWNPRSVTLLACPDCSDYHQNKQSLLRHRKEVHGFVPEFQCELCHVMLLDAKEIEEHITNHEKQTGYVCPICKQTVTTQTSLVRHIRYKHTNEREYKCNICGFSCVEHHKLQIHIRSHTGEAPFSCLECGAAFKSKVSLTRHKATHSDKREYICTLCFQQFAISNTLRNHLRLVHKVDNAFLDGIKNSILHGIPVMLEKFLESTGQNLEDFGKVRYYSIKEEYTSNLVQYFKDVDPILISSDGSNSQTRHVSLEINKKKDGLGFIPALGRRKRKGINKASPRKVKNPRVTDKPKDSIEMPDDFNVVETDGIQENREYEYAFIDTIENGLENDNEQADVMQDYSVVKMEVVREEVLNEGKQVDNEKNVQEFEESESIENVPVPNNVEMRDNDSSKHSETQTKDVINETSDDNSNIETEIVTAIEKEIEETRKDADAEINENNSVTSDKNTEVDINVSEISSKEDEPSESQCAQKHTDICIAVKSNEQLEEMKSGAFGKAPQVIEVLADGSIMDVTEDFSDFLPQIN